MEEKTNTDKIVFNIEEITLFGPRNGKSLKKMYPELQEEPELKILTDKELHFAWLIGNPSSPIDPDIPQSMRYTTAASIVFKDDKETKARYASFEIHDTVKEAIKKMESYSPNARMLAKRGVQSIMKNYLKLIEIDVDSAFLYADKEGNMQTDYTARSQYVSSTKTISEAFPMLIKQLEEGFGITENKKGEEISTKAIDKYHQQKKDRK
jgi:hypothetical protein